MKMYSRMALLLGQIYLFGLSLLRRDRIVLGIGARAFGIPFVKIKNDCKLIVEDNVVLNSMSKPYHASMFSPVKIVADRPGAVIRIGSETRIHGSCIHAYGSISIGTKCLIAANCQIMDGNGHDASFEDVDNRINTIGKAKDIVIEDSVWIGMNSFVLPGVRIGRGSIISAGSVVCNDIPPMCIARGNPAIVIKKYGE